MSRVLKTLYPCKGCGTPAQVERRRDAPHATCDRCAARARFRSSWSWKLEDAEKHALRGNAAGAESTSLFVREWLRALSSKLEAASAMLAFPDWFELRERRKLVRAALARMEKVQEQLGELAFYAAGLVAEVNQEAGIEGVLSGGGAASETRMPANLRVVGADDAGGTR
jgi:hypothetical protein